MHKKQPIKLFIIAELDGNISVSDRQFLYKWIAKSKKNALYYTKIKDLWEMSLDNKTKIAHTQYEWNKFLMHIDKYPQIKNRIVNKWYLIAAALVIGILITNFVITKINSGKTYYITSIAPKGSISKTILPDSTIIYLNAGSKIKYPANIGEKNRNVFLEGEAWFDVAENKKSPFIVHTSFYNIKVIGTQFDVKNHEGQLITTLEKGSVLITSSNNFKMEKNIKLKPGEQIIFNKKNHELILKKIEDTNIYSAWKDNKLIFSKITLGELLNFLEQKYGIIFKVSDQSILKYHYTGTIKNENIIEILNLIKHTLPIEYKIEEQKIIINKK